MAYNTFPVGYQPMYYPTQANAYTTQASVGPTQPTQSGIIWVQGEAGAKSYMVAPNSTVQLWDSENQVIYLKSSDASGMPSMKVLDYTIRETTQPATTALNQTDYVTKEELSAFEKQVMERLEALKKEAKDE